MTDNDPSLFDQPLARTTDPTTSAESAERIAEREGPALARDSQRHRLLDAYREIAVETHGGQFVRYIWQNLTDREAAQHAGLEHAGFWKRCSDLRSAGLIEPTGATRVDSLTDRPVQVCQITAAGKAALAELERTAE